MILLAIGTRRPYLFSMPIVSKVDISMSITSPCDSCLTFRYPVFQGHDHHANPANATLMYPRVLRGHDHDATPLHPPYANEEMCDANDIIYLARLINLDFSGGAH